MGTKFTDIYCLNSVMKIDPNLLKLPIYQYYSLSWKQLQTGKSEFEYDCLKNLDSYIPYSDEEYNFIGNGIEDEFELTPTPSILNTNIYVGIMKANEEDFIEHTNFTFDWATNIIKLNGVTPDLGDKILVTFYNVGEFLDDLNDNEKRILAMSMNVTFLQSQLVNIRSLNQIIYTKSYSIHSQAEQLKQLNVTLREWTDELRYLITKYSYREPRDGMVGLSSTSGKRRWR